jgi:hypothetical protein
MITADLVSRLQDLPPLDLKAIALLAQFDEPDEERLVELQPQLEDAVEDLNRHAERAKEIVTRCLRLRPIPAKISPHGF